MNTFKYQISCDTRERRRKEFEVIESKLHPHVTINDIRITHIHNIRGTVTFFAVMNDGETHLNNREWCVERDTILKSPENFYGAHLKYLEFLVGIRDTI